MPDALPPFAPRFLVSAGLSLTLRSTSGDAKFSFSSPFAADEDGFEPALGPGAGAESLVEDVVESLA